MAKFGQDDRIAKLKVPALGEEKLFLTSFTGHEGVSQLFAFDILALSEDGNINFDPALGQNATIEFETYGHGKRFFTGILAETQRVAEADKVFTYQLTIRPWLWMLSRRFNSQIFHEMAAPDIIAKIFKPYGSLADFETQLEGEFPQLEYCVQHRESDLNFVCRLMEAYGINYHHEFGDGTQKLKLTNSPSAFKPAPGDKRPYIAESTWRIREGEHFYQWVPERRFTTGKATVKDYKFEDSTNEMKSEESGDAKFSPADLEHYDHPFHQFSGKELSTGQGTTFAKARLNSERATDGRFYGSGDCASLAAGMTVKLDGHPTDDKEYLVLRCRHSCDTQAYGSGGGSSGVPYRGEFEFIAADRPFAPPIVTPKPLISGPQTGKVVGERANQPDNDVVADQHGRIKVRFHWNREDDGKPESRTMWCRVAQVWAGPEWGGHFIPRTGMEVLVQFIDGDPDRPVVIGTVYNDKNPPPYDPSSSDEAFHNGWKTLGEKDSGYNELVFIDADSDELIRMHAERDLEVKVENDERRTVVANRETKVGEMMKGDDTLDVAANIKITAGQSITLTVGASTIKMDMTSITISSINISVQAMGPLQTVGATADHSAMGVLSIKAPLVNIN
jgi:type VI secretion system secreted protein VgrG